MWRDMVWHFKKYFGRSTCIGSPDAMDEDAKKSGKRWHRGQRAARGFYLAAWVENAAEWWVARIEMFSSVITVRRSGQRRW